MLGCPVFLQGLLQGLDDPPGVGAFQRGQVYDLAREAVNSHRDLNGPQPPALDGRGVDGPDMVRI